MAKGIDTTVSTLTVAQLADYDFICRYILDAPGGQSKEITKDEVRRFSAGGKRICSNFEWGEAPPDTIAEGKAHAKAFLDWAADFKVPEWSPCYFSQDRNNPAGKYLNYFTGVCDVIGPERSAMYGNGACYRHLLGLGLISYAWHSKSSSYAGNHDTTGANIVQQIKTANVGGHTVDVDIAKTALFGGWLLGEEDPAMTPEETSKAVWALDPPKGSAPGDVIKNPAFRLDSPLHKPPGTNATTGAGYALGDIWRRVGNIEAHVAAIASPAQVAAAVKAALGVGPAITEEQLAAAFVTALKQLAADDNPA